MNTKISDIESKYSVATAKLEESQSREATITVSYHIIFFSFLKIN